MLLGNPAFVTVFYRLFKDIAVAKNLLSLIIGKEIISLEYHAPEYKNKSYTVVHMEFSALVREDNGNEHYLAIELLKAMYSENIIWFREEFHPPLCDIKKYSTVENSEKIAMPVLSIYFLTHCLKHIKVPLSRVDKACIDISTGEILDIEKEEFIKTLTHDSIIVQVSALRGNSLNLLEKVLSVFVDGKRKPEFVDIQEEDYPKEYNDIFLRLLRAGATKNVREQMLPQHDWIDIFSKQEKKLVEQKRQIATLAEIADIDRAINKAIRLIAESKGISLEEAKKIVSQ